MRLASEKEKEKFREENKKQKDTDDYTDDDDKEEKKKSIFFCEMESINRGLLHELFFLYMQIHGLNNVNTPRFGS